MCDNIPTKCSSDIYKKWFIRCRENTSVYTSDTCVLEDAMGLAMTMLEYDRPVSHVDVYDEAEFLSYNRLDGMPTPFYTVRYEYDSDDIVGVIRPYCVDAEGWSIIG